jgi:putative flippase GtrA
MSAKPLPTIILQFWRYCHVGILNTIVGLVTIWLLSLTGWPYPLYTGLAYLLVFTLSFALHGRYSFRSKLRKRAFPLFVGLNLANMVLAQLVQAFFIEITGWPHGLAILAGIGVYVVVGFILNRTYVFKS